MDFTESEIKTIQRAFIIYEKKLPYALRGKGFFIDSITFKEDIMNMIRIKEKLNIIEFSEGS